MKVHNRYHNSPPLDLNHLNPVQNLILFPLSCYFFSRCYFSSSPSDLHFLVLFLLIALSCRIARPESEMVADHKLKIYSLPATRKTYWASRVDKSVRCPQDSCLLCGQNESMHDVTAELHRYPYSLKQKKWGTSEFDIYLWHLGQLHTRERTAAITQSVYRQPKGWTAKGLLFSSS